ncbi:MFS transporter [Streptomyces sp. NPDC048172]|uniref:MFS transporter n=1 Tax=Streptomyces sp. NPDC048172 TaxID=3365505 RepID=UPI003719B226
MTTPRNGPRLGLALTVIAAAQFILVLDMTIMNIALPSIQTDLGVRPENLSWIVNAYALAFGGLILLGGRAGDLFGRRRVFRTGIALFTLASLLGGFAPGEPLLLTARALQGVGAALASPTALALIATTFPEGRRRTNAVAVYASMAGVGSTAGLIGGGLLTDYLDWRWVMFINVPVGALVLLGSRVLTEAGGARVRLDLAGTLTGTAGLVCLVHALTRGGEEGWGDAWTVGFLAVAGALLAAFLVLQSVRRHPMLPLRLFRDRGRSGSYATMLLVAAGMFGMFYFLTLFLQQSRGYSPVRTGLAFLPFSLAFVATAGGLAARLIAFLPPRAVAAPGAVLSGAGMFWLSRLTPGSPYATHLMPALIVTAVGLGLSLIPLTLGAVRGVDPDESGIASGLLDAAQQIGGALGLAVLTTVATTAADGRLPGAEGALVRGLATDDAGLVRRASDALAHGQATAFVVASVLFAAALAIVLTALNTPRPETGSEHPHTLEEEQHA